MARFWSRGTGRVAVSDWGVVAGRRRAILAANRLERKAKKWIPREFFTRLEGIVILFMGRFPCLGLPSGPSRTPLVC